MNRQSTAHKLPFTWDDYRAWDTEERWEVLDGEAYAMSPAPSVRHQRIQGALFMALSQRFAGRRCEVLVSPLDVKLGATDVVQPDLVVVCDARQLLETHIEGAPALVVEILSPSTAQRDRSVKMDAYAIQTQILRSATFAGLTLELAPVFDFPLQPGEEPPAAREPPGRWHRTAETEPRPT